MLGPLRLFSTWPLHSGLGILVFQVKMARSLCEWTVIRGHEPVHVHMTRHEPVICALFDKWDPWAQLS